MFQKGESCKHLLSLLLKSLCNTLWMKTQPKILLKCTGLLYTVSVTLVRYSHLFILLMARHSNCHSFKGCLTKVAELLIYVFTISRLLSIRSFKKNCLSPINHGVLGGVDTRILKIRCSEVEIQ